MTLDFILLLILTAIATYRVSRYLTGDKIGEPIREWAARRSEWLAYLVGCDWCVSTYLGVIGAAALLVQLQPMPLGDDVVWFVALWFSLSGFTGFVSTVEWALDQFGNKQRAEAKALGADVD